MFLPLLTDPTEGPRSSSRRLIWRAFIISPPPGIHRPHLRRRSSDFGPTRFQDLRASQRSSDADSEKLPRPPLVESYLRKRRNARGRACPRRPVGAPQAEELSGVLGQR